MPKLFRVILPVSDIEQAKTFYSLVLGMPGERVSPGRHYFDCGGTVLACYDPVADGDEHEDGWKHHSRQYVYFAVPDLDATLERALQARATIVEGGIQRMPWGGVCSRRKTRSVIRSALLMRIRCSPASHASSSNENGG